MMARLRPGNDQRGVASLFLVIFAALLFLVITTGFAAMMVSELNNSLNSTLSQSAYDAATSGVEDAKRSIIACLNSGNPSGPSCTPVNSNGCYSNYYITGVTGGDTFIKSTGMGTSGEIDQAYTCVQIQMNTPNYLNQLQAETPIMVPLNGVSNISEVEIDWQQNNDGGQPVNTTILGNPLGTCHSSPTALCSQAEWDGAPALMEAQFITPGSSFTLSSLDQTGQTFYLLPFGNVGPNSYSIDTLPPRYVGNAAGLATTVGTTNAPSPVSCSLGPLAGSGTYACNVTITGLSIGAGSQTSFLRLMPIYRGASVRVTLRDSSGNVIDFNGVQPNVDSTGRANDVYRRVDSRLEFTSDAPGTGNSILPTAAVDLGGSLCKDYAVSTNGVTSVNGGPSPCTP